VTSLAHVAKNK